MILISSCFEFFRVISTSKYHVIWPYTISTQYFVNIFATQYRSDLRFVSLERALNSTPTLNKVNLLIKLFKVFQTSTFLNSIITYDFSNTFQSYEGLLRVGEVDLSLPIDSSRSGLSTHTVSIAQIYWPFFSQNIYYGDWLIFFIFLIIR